MTLVLILFLKIATTFRTKFVNSLRPSHIVANKYSALLPSQLSLPSSRPLRPWISFYSNSNIDISDSCCKLSNLKVPSVLTTLCNLDTRTPLQTNPQTNTQGTYKAEVISQEGWRYTFHYGLYQDQEPPTPRFTIKGESGGRTQLTATTVGTFRIISWFYFQRGSSQPTLVMPTDGKVRQLLELLSWLRDSLPSSNKYNDLNKK